MFTFSELLEKVNNEVQHRSEKLIQKQQVGLYQPVEYTLEMGGKRIRPALLLHSYNLFSDDISKALPAALAVEVFHNFTLLHDDIMDKAEMRRNRPTVHKKFSENNAILSGDVMAFLAYEYLLECESGKLTDVARLFTKTAIEVCEGQQYDMNFETRLDVTENEYIEMIRLKTAVLLACSLKAGALLANAPNRIAEQLYVFGINLGLAFQLQDDLLDTFGTQETFGKKIGGDILANKKTFLLIKALETAKGEQLNELKGWLDRSNFHPEEKIRAIKTIYSQLNVQEKTETKIDLYYQQSTEILNSIELSDHKKLPLLNLSNNMLKREY